MVDTTEHLDRTITAQTQMQNKTKAETPQLPHLHWDRNQVCCTCNVIFYWVITDYDILINFSWNIGFSPDTENSNAVNICVLLHYT